jgi:hypothetical protein
MIPLRVTGHVSHTHAKVVLYILMLRGFLQVHEIEFLGLNRNIFRIYSSVLMKIIGRSKREISLQGILSPCTSQYMNRKQGLCHCLLLLIVHSSRILRNVEFCD